jgi:hypothetical protein
MPSFHSWRARGARFLARYLSRLADNLETLTVRLRDAVASAVSQAVAEATQETVRTVLDAAQAPRSSRSIWREPGESPWPEYERDDWPPDYEDPIPRQAPGSSRDPPRRSRWPHTLAAGLHVTAWWLQRGTGRFTVLTAIGIGLLAALAFWFNPLASLGASLIASALGLAGLLDNLSAGAQALDCHAIN